MVLENNYLISYLVLTAEKAEVVLLSQVHVFHRQVPWFLELQLVLPLQNVP